MKEVEVFEFLRAKSSIKGIHIDDLQSLLTDAQKNKTFKNYSIKMLNQGSILIYDSNNNNNILLKCVSEHYCKGKACNIIRKELNLNSEQINCSECYIQYINKKRNNDL